jgi:phosphate-selective porin OprO/OprP
MLRRDWPLAGLAGTIAMLAAGPAAAQSASAQELSELRDQVQALQRKIQQLEGRVAKTDKNAATPPSTNVIASKAPPPAPTAVVKMSPEHRPSICTPDNLNCVGLALLMQVDVGGYRYRPNSAVTVPQRLDTGLNSRRARLGLVGTFLGDWNYALIYDFGGNSDGFGGTASGGIALLPGGGTSGIEVASVSYTGLKPFAIEGGYGSLPWTLDQATPASDLLFMERASSNTVATSIAAGDFRSFAGIRGWDDRLFALVYFTGPQSGAIHADPTGPAGSISATEQYGTIGRLTYQLLADKYYSLHVGGDVEALLRPPVNATTGAQTLTLNDRPELRIDPTSILTTGAIANVAHAEVYEAEGAATYGPLFFQGEYFWYNIDRQFGLPSLDFQGGYAAASWTLTGETHAYIPAAGAYARIMPVAPFSLGSGGWGAWELAARYSVINLNDQLGLKAGAAGGDQSIWTFGLNWYVNSNIRLVFNYLHGSIAKQVSPVVPTNAGAKFDAVGMRTQVAF